MSRPAVLASAAAFHGHQSLPFAGGQQQQQHQHLHGHGHTPYAGPPSHAQHQHPGLDGAGVGMGVGVGVGVGGLLGHPSAGAQLTYRQPQPQPHPHPHPQPQQPQPLPASLPMRPPELAPAFVPGLALHPHPPHPHHAGLAAGPSGLHLPARSAAPLHQAASAMSAPAYVPSDEELAHLQKLSSDFEPEATGPLVGERQSSSAIATEYANADPIYRIKTAALPAKYAFFRTCRGDGHCGWRAIAFTYFEALVRQGDLAKFDEEEARLSSMHNLLNNAGFPEDVYIDWAQEAFDLLHELAQSLRANDGRAADFLLQTFNDESTSLAIMTYFKLLASAWVQSHAEQFKHFVPMGDVKTYCSINIEAANCEIDNVAIVALSEAVINPANIGFEIMYLDRSQGDEVNVSEFSQPISPSAPVIRLLYRPGHYDILYKAEDFPTPIQHSQPMQVQDSLHVAMAAGYSDGFIPVNSNVDVMAMIPGMYSAGLAQRWPPVSYDFEPSPTPQAQMAPIQPYAPTPTPPSAGPSSHSDYMAPVHSTHMGHHNPNPHHGAPLEHPPVTLPIHPPPPPPVSLERNPLTIERGGPFRPSIYELEPGFASGQVHTLPFQTSIFRNSHFNTAHFRNPDFQPEEWTPDAEYGTGNKGRHKSSQ